MLELLLLWISGTLRGASKQFWSLLLAHWSWDNYLWWSVSVVDVLLLRQNLHPQAPAGCHGCMCSDILTISDDLHTWFICNSVLLRLRLTGVVPTSSCLGGSTSAAALDTWIGQINQCLIVSLLSDYTSLITAPPSWFSCIFLAAWTVIRGLTRK